RPAAIEPSTSRQSSARAGSPPPVLALVVLVRSPSVAALVASAVAPVAGSPLVVVLALVVPVVLVVPASVDAPVVAVPASTSLSSPAQATPRIAAALTRA